MIKKNGNWVKKIAHSGVRIIGKVCNRFAWVIARLFPIKKNKITVCSYYGRGYGDNPKYIVEELLKAKKKLNIIWLVKNIEERQSLPEGVKPCKMNTIQGIYHLVTAKFWIDNCRKNFRHKRKKQIYMQTWHGFALKRIERDVQEQLSQGYVRNAIKDSKFIDLIVSDSRFMTQLYNNSFWYDGDIVEWGSPRNDILINSAQDAVEKVRTYFNINKDEKIVIYAPTFRVDKSIEPYSINYDKLKQACEKRFGNKFVVLVRLHSNILQMCTAMEFKEGEVINATYYPDMQELLVAADICITDYSSLMFDFALSRKPCFQFATDIEKYKQDRNFYFELDKLPFSLAQNNKELEQNILDFDQLEYEKELCAFYSKVGMIIDGRASKKCADYILQKIRE